MVLGGESGRDMGVSPVVPEKRLAIIIINFVEMSRGRGVPEQFAIHYTLLASAKAGKERPCRE